MIKSLETKRRNFLWFKFFIILIFTVGGLFLGKILTKSPKTNENRVLGEKHQLNQERNDFLKENSSLIQREIMILKEKILADSNRLLEMTQQKLATSVGEFFYQKSVYPLINQIEKLPQVHQQKIKEYLCR
ncbi:MAG: hypothetical protein NZL96_02320 [Patescibacteria group bacterium]|nr:hypothetical protein [Patescibacteria group bacterium]